MPEPPQLDHVQIVVDDLLRWRLARLERALEKPAAAPFIRWEIEDREPGAVVTPHRVAPRGIEARRS
jgi:hypothetical protein